MKLDILRSGSLPFEGTNGGFLSVTVFCASFAGLAAAAATALLSCFSLVFLSSAS